MKNRKLLSKFLAFLCTVSFFGCPTVMYGTPQDIPVNRVPNEAMAKSSTSSHEGFKQQTIFLKHGPSDTVAGNLPLGGVVGISVDGALVAAGKPPTHQQTSAQPNKNTATVTQAFANVRLGFGNSCPVVAAVMQGDRLTVFGEDMDGFKVQLESGQQGWMNNRVVKSVSPRLGLQEPDVGEEFGSNRGILYLDAALELGYLKGDTTYHISYYEGASGIESELEFPLKTFLIGPRIVWGYRNPQNQDKFQLNLKWLTNIDNGSGKMKDSDWLTDDLDIMEVGSAHPGLDIYSESDIDLKLNIVDINAVYKFWPIKNLSIGPMVGYKFQQFKYDVSNTNQVGYGPYAPTATMYIPGKTLDYKVTYHIPYLGLNSDLLFKDKFRINMKINYSPYTAAEDEDDHILRYKLSKGNTDGYAYLANLNANWNFLPRLFLTIGGEYMKIHTTGTQHQTFYAGPYVGWSDDVDDKITSSQWFFSVMVTYRFSAKP